VETPIVDEFDMQYALALTVAYLYELPPARSDPVEELIITWLGSVEANESKLPGGMD
jgi:hypothetical protein